MLKIYGRIHGRKVEISLETIMKKPLKKWTSRMQTDCFCNLQYWEKYWKKDSSQVWLDGCQLAPEDFLLDCWCIIGSCECWSHCCYRLAAGKYLEWLKQKDRKGPLDKFLYT